MSLSTFFSRLSVVVLATVSSLAWAAPPPLKVQGNRIVDPQGRVVRLTGVNVPSLDWSATGENVLRSIDVALGDWKANVIRIPLTQDLWFGYSRGTNGARLADRGEGYRKLVDQVVKRIADRNAYVLLDLHWSNGGVWGQYVGQHSMPDELSVVFWRDFAKRYANHPAVLFDLYNEPHSVSWEIWRNGGVIEERNEDPSRGRYLKYRAIGLQTILDTVRSTGAKNVVVANGLDWGYDLSGILKGFALEDKTGRGVVYGTHLYPWKQNRDQLVTPVAAKHPIFVGEVGTKPWKEGDPPHENVYTPEWAPAVIDYMDRHQMSYTAWSFHPTANPCIITGWDYQPTAYWGRYVKEALARAASARAKGANHATPVRKVAWDGNTANTAAGWVNPTTSLLKAQNGALEFKFEGPPAWYGAGWNWANWKPRTVGTDITDMTALTFSLRSVGSTGDLQVNLLCNGEIFDTPEHHTEKVLVRRYCPDFLDGRWHTIRIPLADLIMPPTGFDARLVCELQMGFKSDRAVAGAFLLDNIAFDNGPLSAARK